MVGLIDNERSVFICYAHEDRRWLERLLEFIHPLVRQEDLTKWSDEDIKIGEDWHERIRQQLELSKGFILIVSPAFLASDYIASSEVPVLLKHAADRGAPILPLIVSPCLYQKTRFKFPDPKVGPKEILLSSIQSVNPPSRTLIEMSKAEQNRVLMRIALTLSEVL
jgi:hypothetical protein